MSKQFQCITPATIDWVDGVPYARHFEDVYFSKANGLLESYQVFIEGNALKERFANLTPHASFVIGELGFGTGLNFLQTVKLFSEVAPKTAKLIFYSAEKHPLTPEDLKCSLGLWPQLSYWANHLYEIYPVLTSGMHPLVFDNGRITLHLMLGDANTMFAGLLASGDKDLDGLQTLKMDAWFLDGFAPRKNESMWSQRLLNDISLLSKRETTLATFSVAGVVRRGLEGCGFEVFKKPGFGQKRHRLEARFSGYARKALKKPQTPWHVSEPSQHKTRRVIVIGAGLAGAFMAHKLCQKGFQVILLDKGERVASGASGNSQAVLYPNLSLYEAPLTEWMQTAFLFAHQTYKKLLATGKLRGALDGILQLDINAKIHALHTSLKAYLAHYPALGCLVDANQASQLAGVMLTQNALFVPKAGWLDSKMLCDYLIQSKQIEFYPNTEIKTLTYHNALWHVGEYSAPYLVMACSAGLKHFEQTEQLPLTGFRGQMSAVQATSQSSDLKVPLCGDGHVLPLNENGLHWMGASYAPSMDAAIMPLDDIANLEKLNQMPVELDWAQSVSAHWAGVRVKTPDYLPLIGAVPKVDAFKATFKDWLIDGGRYINKAGVYYPGLYVCTGFGSRGLTSIPLATEYLSTLIDSGTSPLSRHMMQSVAPARFLVKAIIRNKGVFE